MAKSLMTVLIALTMCPALALFTGCQSMDRGYEGLVGMTDPDKVRLQTKVKWMNPQPRIRPVSADNRVVYCRVRNSAGADIDFYQAVKNELGSLGYELVPNIDEAQFYLSADVRYFGEGAMADRSAVVAMAGVGAVAGGIIGHQSDHTLEGAGIGGAAGALVGDIISKRNKIRQFNLNNIS